MHDVPTEPAASRKRPRLDLSVTPAGRERKRGKSMFGLVLGTLKKAKNEDQTRNASEAAKKRQLIEQRLQDKLRKETDSVRRAEEAKKDKTTAIRREEELQLKDSIHKLRRTRLPLLANFLLTSDRIPSDDETPIPTRDPLSLASRTQPAPIYYLPAILTPAQETYLARRKADVKEAAEKEWEAFREERSVGIEEIMTLRKRVAEEDARKKALREAGKAPEEVANDVKAEPRSSEPPTAASNGKATPPAGGVAEMDVDETVKEEGDDAAKAGAEDSERKDEPVPMQADDDDAVEY
ncbi:hypothetical protein FA95DRAFT_1499835 [Auriscalpium vulgare]|uniref:Uncharacterized protein n=1 Tax=Auriscalpium vulgare TaxID=40419 RepID=A0ACB8REX2_9AGAM|nr:hypothetical protein FA95DRAFT_1499835 [Auriscalpium vulgare]